MNFEFAPKSFSGFFLRAHWLLQMLLVLSLIVLASASYQLVRKGQNFYQIKLALNQQQNQQQNRQESKQTSARLSVGEALPKEKVNLINQQIDLLNTAWPDLFDALETNKGEEIVLLEIAMLGADKKLLMMIEAERYEALIELIERLKRSETFHNVTLNRHETMQKNGQFVIRAQMQASWQ